MSDSSDRREAMFALASTIATYAIAYVMYRVMSDPDFVQRTVMRGARYGEQYCMRQAGVWARRADQCTTVYQSARSGVTV